MLEAAAALSAGLGTFAAILVVVVPSAVSDVAERAARRVARFISRGWAVESSLATHAAWAWLDGRGFVVLQISAAIAGAIMAVGLTGLPALAAPGAIGAGATVRAIVAARARSEQVIRQDAVLESVRMLRQLLETGAASVNQALEILGRRGPAPLRSDFRAIAATTLGRGQAWARARERIAEPLFDMLAAAVLIQGPGGGELAPLFADLEASVSAAQEVEREARALQVQARSASSIIVSLPIAFLVVLSTLHSPYLDAFHKPEGEMFLLAMLGIMGCSYIWMRRLLQLPGLERVRLSDA
jgi:Flp pilus assembly protein TadB